MGYDSYKYLNSFIDFNRNEVDYSNDPITGKVTQVKYPLTQGDTQGQGNTRPTTNYTYTNGYFLHTAQDEGGQVTTINRYGDNRIQNIVYPDGGWESFTYDAVHFSQVSTHRVTTGGTESWAYDGLHRLQYYSDPYHNNNNSPSIRYYYDALGRVNGIYDALNHPTNWEYNDRGQVTKTTLAPDPFDGNNRNTVINYYNSDGTLQYTTDPLGGYANDLAHTTTYTYDNYRRLKTITGPRRGQNDNNRYTTSFYYGANPSDNVNDYKLTDSNVTYVVPPSGKKTKILYNDNRGKSSLTVGYQTGDDATTTYAYDGVGNLRTITKPLNHSNLSTLYDERSRPYSISVGGQITTITYDTAGRQKTVNRPNGQVLTNYSFDEMNRVTQQNVTQTPDPTAITKYEYYDYGPVALVHTMKDPHLVALNNGEQYEYIYDAMGRKLIAGYPHDSNNPPAQTFEAYNYDDVGQLAWYMNRNGKTQTFTYDALNRLNWLSWDDGVTPTVHLLYDAASRLTEIDNANASISRVYYNDNLLYQETEQILVSGGGSKTMTYTYDADGNRASTAYPDGGYSFSYTYTGRNQLETVNSWASYGYDTRGNLTGRTLLANNRQSAFGYDTLDRVTQVVHSLNGTTRTINYGYYPNSNDRKWTQRLISGGGSENNKGEVFSYDLADQAIGVQLNVASPQNVQSISPTISYDHNGNRTVFGSDTYGPANNLNQYINRNGTYTDYDYSGNLSQGFDGSAYQYDAQNRLTSAPGMTFKYDGLNRRVSRTWNGATTFSVWDGWNLVEEYQSGGTITAAYVYGAGGLIAGTYSGQVYYYYQDGIGSTSHLTDSNGVLKEWYRYDLQGNPFFYDANNNQRNPNQSSFGVRHLFTGQQWYKELGLYDLRNRFYSPDIGRFLQPDPIGFSGDSTNLYRYCGNNALTRSDPGGLLTYLTGIEANMTVGLNLSVTGQVGFSINGWNPLDWRLNAAGSLSPFTTVVSNIGVNAGPIATLSAAERVEDLSNWSGAFGGGYSWGLIGVNGTVSNVNAGSGKPVAYNLAIPVGPSLIPPEFIAGAQRTWAASLSARDFWNSVYPAPGGTTQIDNVCPDCDHTMERVTVTGTPTNEEVQQERGLARLQSMSNPYWGYFPTTLTTNFAGGIARPGGYGGPWSTSGSPVYGGGPIQSSTFGPGNWYTGLDPVAAFGSGASSAGQNHAAGIP
jgi:RHS repeat-associated protein